MYNCYKQLYKDICTIINIMLNTIKVRRKIDKNKPPSTM